MVQNTKLQYSPFSGVRDFPYTQSFLLLIKGREKDCGMRRRERVGRGREEKVG